MNTKIHYDLPFLRDETCLDKIHQEDEGERSLGVEGEGIVVARL